MVSGREGDVGSTEISSFGPLTAAYIQHTVVRRLSRESEWVSECTWVLAQQEGVEGLADGALGTRAPVADSQLVASLVVLHLHVATTHHRVQLDGLVQEQGGHRHQPNPTIIPSLYTNPTQPLSPLFTPTQPNHYPLSLHQPNPIIIPSLYTNPTQPLSPLFTPTQPAPAPAHVYMYSTCVCRQSRRRERQKVWSTEKTWGRGLSEATRWLWASWVR